MKELTLAALLTAVLAGPAWAARPIDESRPLDPAGTVEIENVAGSVEVVGWDEDRVEITGSLADTAEELDVDGSARRLEIRVEEHRRSGHTDPTELVIRLPRTAAVEIETISADVVVRDLAGFVEVESVSGRVEIGGAPSRLEAATVSGDIRVARAPDGSELESVSGDVEVERADGRIDVANVSGGIRIEGGRVDGADLESVSGTIRCTADLFGGSIDVETMSGTIVLVVPADLAAEFEVSTFSGSIRSEIGPEPRRTSRYTPGRELSFVTGDGGPRIGLTSFSGSVRIETR